MTTGLGTNPDKQQQGGVGRERGGGSADSPAPTELLITEAWTEINERILSLKLIEAVP